MPKEIFFLIIFLIIIYLEYFYPNRNTTKKILPRHIGNTTLLPVNLLVTFFTQPLLLSLIALYIYPGSFGLLNTFQIPWLYSFIFSFLILDLSMYLQHRVLHASDFFWKLHALHHSDNALDSTTYFRHHPFETLITIMMTYCVVIIFGISPEALAFYLLINNVMQLIQHSNMQLPTSLDWLSTFLVTPKFHTIHHSIHRPEADSNFSTIFTIWDKLFGTFTEPSKQPQELGVTNFTHERYQGISTMLAMPFLVHNKIKSE